jgi:glycolate oxidase
MNEGSSARVLHFSVMRMPAPDPEALARRPVLLAELQRVLPPGQVVGDPEALRVYESDGLTAYRQAPMLAVLPETTEQVRQVLRICRRLGMKVVPRGAGTSLSGGALPLADGVLLGLGKFNRILEVDLPNRCVVAQSGVTNQAITDAVRRHGFYYAPDPSSQIACTIGGNVSENSGGVHCLKYGLTTNNVLGVELVTMDGEILRIGGKHVDPEGYDLLGLINGSEGLLGVITEVTVRILQSPPDVRAMLLGFPANEAAGECVGRIIAAGIIPAGIEMMDELAIGASERYSGAGYPLDCPALLIVELDGVVAEVDSLVASVTEIALGCSATLVRVSHSDEERMRIWAGRKAAFPAMGMISPDYYCMDGTIPRRELPRVLARMAELSAQYGLRVANVFHAGDGNLHPLILFDANRPGELERAEAFGADILRLCVEVGGVLSGEHGIGVEKRDLMPVFFTSDDLAQQQRVKCAFDPEGRLNPGKMFPTLHRCAELGKMHVHHGALPFSNLPRF